MSQRSLTFFHAALLAALASTGGALAQPPTAGEGAQSRTDALTEADIGFTMFRPRNAIPQTLMHYAEQMTEPMIAYLARNPATGVDEIRRRSRFVAIADSIGVQGDEAGRKEAIAFLEQIDAFLGQSSAASEEEAARSQTTVRTLRLKSVTVDSAVALLSAMAGSVEKEIVRETGTIVLRGTVEAVGRAESLLREVDQPSPQMTVHITLVEAAAEGEGDVDAELAQALGTLLPGKSFREVGRFMTRASVSGATPLELTSNFAGAPGAVGVPPPRFQFKAGSRAWDPATRTLSLGRTELRVDTPMVQTVASGGKGGGPAVVQQSFSGYGSAGISTDLALLASQRTVVGTVGDNSLFVVLKVDVSEVL